MSGVGFTRGLQGGVEGRLAHLEPCDGLPDSDSSNSHFEILVGFFAYKIAKSGSKAQIIDLYWSFCGVSLTSSGQNENCCRQSGSITSIAPKVVY